MTNVIGIDPSLTGTAVCVLAMDGTLVKMSRLESKPAQTLGGRIARYEGLADDVAYLVEHHRPVTILLEGYSFGSQGRAVVTMGEYGAILRQSLVKLCGGDVASLREVPPSCVKLFAAGKGNADKMAVAVALAKRYGVEFKTSDEYDAYALSRMAACIAGFIKPANDAQQRAIDGAINGTAKKQKKAKT